MQYYFYFLHIWIEYNILTDLLSKTKSLSTANLSKGRVKKFMVGKLVDFSTKENDVMWIVGGLEVSESILVHQGTSGREE